MKIVCLGDSLTYGFGVRRSKSWVHLSEEKLELEIINEGISGDTTTGMNCRFYNSVYMQKPDYVFIMGGTNDMISGADLGIVKSNIMSMVHRATAKYITPIVGIPPNIDLNNVRKDWAEFTEFYNIVKELKNYREWILKFCKTYDVKYIDFYGEIEKYPGNKSGLYIDGLHFNEEGNALMAEIFCDAMRS